MLSVTDNRRLYRGMTNTSVEGMDGGSLDELETQGDYSYNPSVR